MTYFTMHCPICDYEHEYTDIDEAENDGKEWDKRMESLYGTENNRLRNKVNTIMDGQDALKAQTVRIRRALTNHPEQEVDTLDIALQVRSQRDEALAMLRHVFTYWRKYDNRYFSSNLATDVLDLIRRIEETLT